MSTSQTFYYNVPDSASVITAIFYDPVAKGSMLELSDVALLDEIFAGVFLVALFTLFAVIAVLCVFGGLSGEKEEGY